MIQITSYSHELLSECFIFTNTAALKNLKLFIYYCRDVSVRVLHVTITLFYHNFGVIALTDMLALAGLLCEC